MKTYKIEKQLTPIAKYDCVVLGGGPSGWVAAVSAARLGLKTALIERFGFLGGLATGGYVVPLSGLYLNGLRVIDGITWEFSEKLIEMGAATLELPKGHLSFDPESYKLLAARMVADAGVELYTNSYFSGCVAEDGRVVAVTVENKNGTELIEGEMFIDATGDADLFHQMGLPMLEKTDALQPLSLCFVLGGVDLSTHLVGDYIHHDGVTQKNSCQVEIQAALREAVEKGEAPQFGGPWFNALVTGDHIAVNITRAAADACDNRDYSVAEARLREDMFALVAKLREMYPEFKNAYIASSGVAGIRETRHIRARHLLTGVEMLEGVTTDDTVAYAAHPVDIHIGGGSEQICRRLTKPGTIPFSCMISDDCPNLIAVGRSVCADREAYASLRVQATVMAMGEAAGAIAALAVGSDRDVRSVTGADIQKTIKFKRSED